MGYKTSYMVKFANRISNKGGSSKVHASQKSYRHQTPSSLSGGDRIQHSKLSHLMHPQTPIQGRDNQQIDFSLADMDAVQNQETQSF